MPEPRKSKAKNGSKIAIVILSVLALAGIGFGVYGFFFKAPENACENNDTIATDASEVVTNDVINDDFVDNLVEKYLFLFGFLHNTIDDGLTEDTKVRIAYGNIPEYDDGYVDMDLNGGCGGEIISYDSLNSSYKKLFGSNENIEKKNYYPNETLSFEFDDSSDKFTVNYFCGGGTGAELIEGVSNYSVEDEKLIVDIAHDIADATTSPATLELTTGEKITLSSLDDDRALSTVSKEVIGEYGDKMHHYLMTFTKDAETNQYILESITDKE